MSGVMWFAGKEARRRWLEALLLAALGGGATYAAWMVNWPEYGRGVAVVLGLVWLVSVARIWRGAGMPGCGMAWWTARPVRAWEPVVAWLLVSAGLLLVAGGGWVSVTRAKRNMALRMEEAQARLQKAGAVAAGAAVARVGSTGVAASLAGTAESATTPAGTTAVAATSQAGTTAVSDAPSRAKKRHHRRHR